MSHGVIRLTTYSAITYIHKYILWHLLNINNVLIIHIY